MEGPIVGDYRKNMRCGVEAARSHGEGSRPDSGIVCEWFVGAAADGAQVSFDHTTLKLSDPGDIGCEGNTVADSYGAGTSVAGNGESGDYRLPLVKIWNTDHRVDGQAGARCDGQVLGIVSDHQRKCGAIDEQIVVRNSERETIEAAWLQSHHLGRRATRRAQIDIDRLPVVRNI